MKLKRKLAYIGTLSTLLLTSTSIATPVIVFNSKNNNFNQYNTTFKNINEFDFGFNTKLASSVNNEWIKQQIIDHKDQIFNSYDSQNNDFYQLNLIVSEIITNDINGTVSFKLTLKNSNNNNNSISSNLTFIGFNKQTSNIYYSIQFNNQSTYNFGDSNILASNSSINETWIKNKLIEYKNDVFQINNSSNISSFDWNKNLIIGSIQSNDNNGTLNFNVSLQNATNNQNLNKTTISKTLTFSGFLNNNPSIPSIPSIPSNPSNPSTPSNPSNSSDIIISDNPDYIPDDKPNKKPISDLEKKWGDVLLPQVDDNLITEDDLINMLDQHFENTNYVKITFGQRKISSTLMANAFSKWITTRWKYFPYFAFSNPVFRINLKDENGKLINWKNIDNWNSPEIINKTYYVESLSTYKGEVFDYYADKWLTPGFYKNSFIEFVNNFLNLISFDMSGIDKAWTAYYYVANYLNYEDSSSIEATIVNHKGVCADYASLMSLLCNIVGVPSLPMVTSHNNINYTAMHEIVWVYIDDLIDGKTKKWYAMDPTFAYSRNGSYNGPISFWANNLTLENVIFNFSSDPYKMYPSDEHYNSNLFFNAPWQTLYENNSLETRNIPSNFVSESANTYGKSKSNPVYYDGYWYYYCWDNKDQTNKKHNNKLVRSKFITGDTYEVVIDFSNPSNPDPNHFGFNVSKEICELFKWFSTSKFRYHAFGYNEKIVLATDDITGDFNHSVKFLIIDLKTKESRLINQTFDYYKSSLKDFNYYIKNGEIYYTSDTYGNGQNQWKNKTYAKLQLTEDEYNFLNSTTDLKSQLFRKITLYRTVAGTYLSSGNDPVNNVSPESKREFLEYLYNLEQQLNKDQINDIDKTIAELDLKYKDFIPSITSQGIIKTNELSDVYQYEKDYVNSLGYLPLNKLLLIDSFSDFTNNNNNIAIDIYYSKTKDGTYKKVKNELYLEAGGINVSLSDINQSSYDGYYYFDYYPYGLNNQKQRSKTFEIQIVDRKTLPDYEGLKSQSKNNTNYYKTSDNWYDNKIALNFNLYGVQNVKNDIILKLKYINPDTNQIVTLDTINVNRNNSQFTQKWAINKPSNSNHGIYWVEYTTNLDNTTYNFYSNFYFHFTKEDVENFSVKKWMNLSNKIYHTQ